jgi:uncharacterized membrane protein
MVAGLVAGFALPSLDAALDVDLPVFAFTTEDAARSLLQTVATATVSVAGLSFSVTVVAFTLASSQLSPRVLRTFRADRLTQATLALLLATFVYCLAVLVRLGSVADGEQVPNLSMTLAIVLAVASFATFAAFIAHIVRLLQPSSIIDGVRQAGRRAVEQPYPHGTSQDPDDVTAAARAVAARRSAAPRRVVQATGEGYVTTIRGARIMSAATGADALVVQRVPVGDYVAPGTALADVWCPDGAALESLQDAVHGAIVLGTQRRPVQDPAFPVRQLADIALKGLSPGVNDPTTAENAIDALAAVLIRAAGGEPAPLCRLDEAGTVRFVACAPDLDDLVRLGFEQVRIFAAPYPVVSRRLLVLLERVEDAARRHGVPCLEPARQAALIAEGPQGEVSTRADVDGVRTQHAGTWGSRGG